MFHCWTQSSINSSPAILLTYTLPSLLCKRNLDSSLKITWDHCSAVQSLWARVNSRRAYLCRAVRRGFFLSLRPMCPASLSLLRVVGVDTLTPCSSCIFAFISGVFFLFRPGILRSCTLPVIRFFFLQNIANSSLATACSDNNFPLWIAFLRQCQHVSQIFKANPWLWTHDLCTLLENLFPPTTKSNLLYRNWMTLEFTLL